MSDVFISYARSSEEQAKQVEQALRDAGYSVWRDAELPAHRTYAQVIEEQLKLAKAVLVLWAAEATDSHWVRAEADSARELGKLVQAKVDATMPPIPFNQIQCAELQDWDGDTEHPGWRKVRSSIAALTGDSDAPEPSPKPRRNKISVCVLPFQNMSGDEEQEYFSDGISEDITTDLARLSALEVIARNTAFTFKNQSVDVCNVARKLGVSHVLEGSVRKAGNRVRITAQLINGSTGKHAWAERYDRDLNDIFAIQDEIAKAIVEALKVKLLPGEKNALGERFTNNAEAYNLYLMARNYWVTGNHGDARREERVVRICQRAVELDPNYAQAWALLAIAQSNLRYGFGRSGDDGVEAARTALAIDPTVPEAHCAMARRLRETGRHDEAVAELQKGLALDPESWDLNKAAANHFMFLGQVEQAIPHFEKAATVAETDYHSWGMLLTCYQGLGKQDEAAHAARNTLAQAERVLAEDPTNGAAISFAVSALAFSGDRNRAKEWMDRALLVDPDNLNMRYNFACALAKDLNDREGALAMLKYALARVKGGLVNVEADPDFESIRDDPRFHKMLADARRRLGLESPVRGPADAQ